MELAHTVREAVLTAARYGRAAAQIAVREKPWSEEAVGGGPLFVVGAPRSGTTFLAGSLGAQPGVVDLGEVRPLKAAIPALAAMEDADAAVRVARILDRTRRLALARKLRFVEQTPEVGFVLASALRAYPDARAVHIVRDGRDVATSLLERGWLSAGRAGSDDAQFRYGAHARFWVEPDRVQEFSAASDATRAGWAWRRYVEAARSVDERVVEVRYEAMVSDPEGTAAYLGDRLGLDPDRLGATLSAAHDRSAGRWRRDLTAEQVADVEREAGPLLRELGYESAQT
jgi:hypothetical protein